MEYLVITAVGPDRQGIMDDLARSVSNHGVNIEETKAAVLGGEFAVIMLVSGLEAAVEGLRAKLADEFPDKALVIAMRPTDSPMRWSGVPYVVESISLDTPGIVRTVTAVLRAHGINIEEIESASEPAPLSGAPLFRMWVLINVTPGARLNALKADLARTAEAHDLDISVKPYKPGAAEA